MHLAALRAELHKPSITARTIAGSQMSGIFFTSPLFRSTAGGPAWAQVEAYFPNMQVFANALLSAYATQTPDSFAGFRPSSAQAYIVTPETPMIDAGGILIPARKDNTVYLMTDHLTFWLEVNNGGSQNPATSAWAVGVIYDTTPSAVFNLASPVQQLELAVHTEDGTVVGTHQSFRLDGGPEFDEDETRERVLAQAYASSKRDQGSLRVATFDHGQMPVDTDFRVNPSTGQAEPLRDQVAGENPLLS